MHVVHEFGEAPVGIGLYLQTRERGGGKVKSGKQGIADTKGSELVVPLNVGSSIV